MKLQAVFLFLFISLMSFSAFCQDQYKVVNIGFYNLENLFDTLDTPGKLDEEFTPKGTKLYNTAMYTDKLTRLSTVISMLGKDVSPDGIAMLGVAEVENRKVLEDLVAQPLLKDMDLHIIHYESEDFRGIDVGLLYQPKYFTPISSKPINLPIYNSEGEKIYTRQTLYAAGIMDGDTIHILVNHWPSRRGGSASEPLRMQGAAICKSVKDSILAVNPGAKVIVMGDLNDDPTDKSLVKSLKAKGSKKDLNADEMYNPYVDFYKKGIGTTAYQDAWSLFDQVIVSPGWISDTTGYHFYKTRVFNEKFITEKSGKYKGYPQRTFSGDSYNFGYSDHFPVYLSFVKKL
ncbi:MAG: endonuclease/exonuclease/phosphatase family protein [Saprospiraceae bacterium]|nr:endonuclease/exonuclease/phosphatase family protein [Candidatus Brachybacter algidus]